MKTIFPFTSIELPPMDQVGGKALALITMTREGMPVPPGFVLTVKFFAPWMATLQATPEWEAILNSGADEFSQATKALQPLCRNLQFNHHQQDELQQALESFQASCDVNLFAVRSSSPEEDLDGAFFAGGYETTLGVTVETIKPAILHSFTSGFDERVFLYKKEHGFPIHKPRIAVVVQRQVDADLFWQIVYDYGSHGAFIAPRAKPTGRLHDHSACLVNFCLHILDGDFGQIGNGYFV